MPPMGFSLKERLRYPTGFPTDPLCVEAADEIDRLEDKVEELRGECSVLIGEKDNLVSDVGRLRGITGDPQ